MLIVVKTSAHRTGLPVCGPVQGRERAFAGKVPIPHFCLHPRVGVALVLIYCMAILTGVPKTGKADRPKGTIIAQAAMHPHS